jgi:hypothetical protein
MRSSTRHGVCLAVLLVGLIAGTPRVARSAPRGGTVSPAVTAFADDSIPVKDPREQHSPNLGIRGPALPASVSQLAYPAGAEIWADARGEPNLVVTGATPGFVQRARVVVCRPKSDALKWPEFIQLYVRQGLLPASPDEPLATVFPPKGNATDPNANEEETHVFRMQTPGEYLVLGLIRNLATQHQLGYTVVLSGRLDPAQALIQGRSIATELAMKARMRLLVPPNAAAAEPEYTLRGATLQGALPAILRDPTVPQRVKEMAKVVIPQATSIIRSAWRTAAPMSDQEFFDFYTRQAERLDWGAPLLKDETQPGRPTLLFQRPGDQGVVMVRAQATPLTVSVVTQPSTTLYILVMQGKINASGLRGK